MAFKLVKRSKLPVRVKGSLPEEDGAMSDFDFKLHCKRLTQDQLDALMTDKEAAVKAFVVDVAEGWEGMVNADGAPVAFSEEGLADLIENPGLPMLILQAYLKQVAAVAKN